LYYRYKNITYKYNSADLIKKYISRPCFYVDVIDKAKKLISNTSKILLVNAMT